VVGALPGLWAWQQIVPYALTSAVSIFVTFDLSIWISLCPALFTSPFRLDFSFLLIGFSQKEKKDF